ncbi:MAG: AAA family ATPase [Candidatus Helarchaeota archaeon]
MFIKKVIILNFRNFDYFESELEKFCVIIGPNNIGKSNFLSAINLALSPTRFQISYLNENDFKNPEKPIVIEIQFSDLQDSDHPIFKNYINPDNDTITIQFKAYYKEDLIDYEFESYFINNSLPDDDKILDPFTNIHKKYIYFRFIDAYRDFKSEIFSSKNSLIRLLKSIMPHYTCPLDNIKKQIITDIDSVNNICAENQINYKLIKFFKKCVILYFNKKEPLSQDFPKIEVILDCIAEKFSNLSNIKLKNELLKYVNNKIRSNLLIFYYRNKIRANLKELDILIIKNTEFQNLSENLTNLIQNIFTVESIEFSMEPEHDERLLQKIELLFNEISIKFQGRGYQNILILILTIMESIYKCENNEEIGTFILSIEELENHLHPAIQRNFLEFIRTYILENSKISSQIIITTHSPNIIKNVKFNELIKFNKSNSKIEAVKLSENIIDSIINNRSPPQDKISKWRKNLWTFFNILFTIYPEIFFARFVIIVEGPSEAGALPVMGQKNNLDFDRNNISIICSEGKDNFEYISTILEEFKINYLIIRDRDKMNDNEIKLWKNNRPNRFITYERKFEFEIVKSIDNIKLIKLIIDHKPESKNKIFRDIKKINELKSCINFEEIFKKIQDPNIFNKIKNKVFKKVAGWLDDCKGYYFGKEIAELIDENGNNIPQIYKDIFNYIINSGVLY